MVREEFYLAMVNESSSFVGCIISITTDFLYDATAKVLTERPKSYPSGASLSLATNILTS